jgi:hypothetical protein
MSFWVREIAGWLLVLLGLFIFYICFAILLGRGPLFGEAFILTVIGIVVYRSGIHLLKVAVAARVCMHAQARLRDEERREGYRPTAGAVRTRTRLPAARR